MVTKEEWDKEFRSMIGKKSGWLKKKEHLTDSFYYSLDATANKELIYHTKGMLQVMENHLFHSYMARCINKEVPDSLFETPYASPDNSWNDDFRKVKNTNLGDGSKHIVRIRAEHYVAQLNLINMRDNDGNDDYVCMLSIDDAKENCVAVYPIYVAEVEGRGTIFSMVGDTGFYFPMKYGRHKTTSDRDWFEVTQYGRTARICSLFPYMLHLAAEPQRKIQPPEYSKLEIKMLKTIYNNLHINFYSTAIKGRIEHDVDEASMKIFDEWNKVVPDKILPDNDDGKYPIFDLRKKDDKFMKNYVVEHGIKLYDKDYHVNLYEYFADPKYGNIFRTPAVAHSFDTDTGKEQDTRSIEMLTYIKVDHVKMYMRVHFVHKISPTFSTAVIIDLRNINNFNIMKDIVSIREDLIFKGNEYLMRDMDEFKSVAPMVSLGTDAMIFMLTKLITMYIIIKDRPDRHRMVTRKEKVVRHTTSKGGKKKEEVDYVITHILKNSSDAKKYVEEMTNQAEMEHRQVEYVLESWKRGEHYRHYKSGKVVKIKEQECHRRKEMTKKQIIVKM